MNRLGVSSWNQFWGTSLMNLFAKRGSLRLPACRWLQLPTGVPWNSFADTRKNNCQRLSRVEWKTWTVHIIQLLPSVFCFERRSNFSFLGKKHFTRVASKSWEALRSRRVLRFRFWVLFRQSNFNKNWIFGGVVCRHLTQTLMKATQPITDILMRIKTIAGIFNTMTCDSGNEKHFYQCHRFMEMMRLMTSLSEGFASIPSRFQLHVLMRAQEKLKNNCRNGSNYSTTTHYDADSQPQMHFFPFISITLLSQKRKPFGLTDRTFLSFTFNSSTICNRLSRIFYTSSFSTLNYYYFDNEFTSANISDNRTARLTEKYWTEHRRSTKLCNMKTLMKMRESENAEREIQKKSHKNHKNSSRFNVASTSRCSTEIFNAIAFLIFQV